MSLRSVALRAGAIVPRSSRSEGCELTRKPFYHRQLARKAEPAPAVIVSGCVLALGWLLLIALATAVLAHGIDRLFWLVVVIVCAAGLVDWARRGRTR